MLKDYSKIDPQLRSIAKMYPRFTFNHRTTWFINWMMSWLPAPKIPGEVRVENLFISGQDEGASTRLRIYRPKALITPMPAMIWLHGGGYVIGKPEMDDRLCADYVRALGIAVISVDYRYAPKYPFPAGLDDSYAALMWVASQSQQLSVDAKRIAIGGVSAGGGLAAALAQRAHDLQQLEPIFQLLVYPMLDDRTVLRADIDDRDNMTWTQTSNRFGWESYLGQECGLADVPAYAVPARRKDLSGLPPTWIGVGSLDVFHDEDVAYGQRLTACGVECELVIVPGAFHGFDVFSPQRPIVQDFRKSQIAALKKHLCP